MAKFACVFCHIVEVIKHLYFERDFKRSDFVCVLRITACFANLWEDFFKDPVLELDRFGFVGTENNAVEVRFVDESDLLMPSVCKGCNFIAPLFIQAKCFSTSTVYT